MATAKMRATIERKLIKLAKVAESFDVDTETLRKWVKSGDFPEPHSIIQRTCLYDKAVIDQYLATGVWPVGTRFRKGVGMGRAAR